MSAIRDKVEQALKDMGIRTGDKTIKIHPTDWAALKEELMPDDSTNLHPFAGIVGANVVIDEFIPLGDILVEQKTLRWY
jgi:hypothetical protein